MKLLETISIECAGATRKIDLYRGDLTSAPSDFEADILVVSAFRGDYTETPSSLIGALSRDCGLSIRSLADQKELDLRTQFSCWLSKPLKEQFFTQILCIESGWRGTPPEITDDLFRALAPILMTDPRKSIVAMPIIGAGDQGFDTGRMLELIVATSTEWMKRGLPLKHLKIFTNKDLDNHKTKGLFSVTYSPSAAKPATEHDIFVSYSHKDRDVANFVCDTIQQIDGKLKIFIDHSELRHGGSWPMQLATAIDASRRVVALYSPTYWDSNNCKMEFLAAMARQHDTGSEILFPIYLKDANIPYFFKSFHYADCRVDDREKLRKACLHFVSSFS